MPADHAVGTGPLQLLELGQGRRRGEDVAVDRRDTAVHQRQPMFAEPQIEPPRQSCHPRPRIGIELAVGVGEPGRRQMITLASGHETAAAIAGTPRQAFLAVPHDQLHAGAANEVDSRGGIAATTSPVQMMRSAGISSRSAAASKARVASKLL